ncbi:Uma2 family endonuclease [Meiothermus rufus]|uniref:Uma2 family endonuclease n=1 Tax=Meiothermus rufus TaxID=604332 RepID=UPI0004821807|nr:Uma2 family endonuclease [Meiothermus rufus]
MAVLEPQSPSRRYRLTVEDFYRLNLPPDKRYELIEGVVYEMPAIEPLHATLVRKFQAVLHEYFRGRALVSTQNPLHLGQHSMPQPDLALIRVADYRHEHPKGEDVYLVTEIAVSTLEDDRKKLIVYAKTGIPEVWIVHLEAYRVEIYRQPTGDRCLSHVDHDPTKPVTPLAFPDTPRVLSW